MTQKYKIRYKFEPETRPEHYTKEDVGDCGLCDACIFISIIKPDDGSYSQALLTLDGAENRPLTQSETFKAWMMIGLSLHDERGLHGWQADCVEDFADTLREFMKTMRDNDKHDS